MTIQDYLYKLFYFLGLDESNTKISINDTEQSVEIYIEIPEEKEKHFIGSRGQNLRALRTILASTFFDQVNNKRLLIDVNNYLKNQERSVVEKAFTVARQVLETGQPQTIYDLNAYERYLVHSNLAQERSLDGVGSYSTSVGSKRYLTICLLEDLPNTEEE